MHHASSIREEHVRILKRHQKYLYKDMFSTLNFKVLSSIKKVVDLKFNVCIRVDYKL